MDLKPAASESTAATMAIQTDAPNTKSASEKWADIPGYEGYYQASSLGLIRSLPRTIPRPTHPLGDLILKGRILRPGVNKRGYHQVALCRNKRQRSIFVHKLVALAFYGESEGCEVNHIDGNKNNNALENLEYVSHKANMVHAGQLGLMQRDQARDACGRFKVLGV